MKIDEYDWRARALAKAESRDADEYDIAKAGVSRDEVPMRNAFIPANVARNAKIVDWGYE